MEKKTKLTLQVNVTEILEARVELENGLVFDAYILPLNTTTELDDGSLEDAPIEGLNIGVELVASYTGTNSEVL